MPTDEKAAEATGSFDYSVPTDGSADGTYSFYPITVDKAGNREAVPGSPDTTTTVTDTQHDTQAPGAPTIDQKPSDPSNDGSPSFEFSGEPGGSFQCKLDSGS